MNTMWTEGELKLHSCHPCWTLSSPAFLPVPVAPPVTSPSSSWSLQTLIGLTSGGDESAYRWEIDHLVTWCSLDYLELNALKTREIVMDFRKNPDQPAPIILCGSPVNSVESCRFQGTIITQDLKWELNIRSLNKKAQQRMFFLRQLKKFNLPKTMMVHFC